MESAQRGLAVSAGELACAARLVALLAQYRFQLASKDHSLLLAHLFPDVADTDDQVSGLLVADELILKLRRMSESP